MGTITITEAPPVVLIGPGSFEVGGSYASVGAAPEPATYGDHPRDQLVIVEAITENRLFELRGFDAQRPSWVLNGIGSMRFTGPASDPALLECLTDPDTEDMGTAELKTIGREAQFWRDGELLWAGPVVSAEVDMGSGLVTFDAMDLGWYLSRRFMGAAERRDLLEGIGQMDGWGLPGWSRMGDAAAVRNTTTKVRGAGAAQVSGAGSLQASFVHPEHNLSTSLAVHLTAMVRIPAGTPVGTLVLSIITLDDDGDTVLAVAENSWRTTQETPTGAWVRATAYSLLPPGDPYTVQVNLWSQDAVNTYFDDVRVQKNDTTGIPAPGAALTTHGVAIVNHAQDGRDQGTFGLKPVVLAASDTVEVLGIRHLEHTQVLDLFESYTDRDDGWDWWPDPKYRRICFAPRRGVDRTDIALHDRSVASGGWIHDESQVSSKVVVIGDGDGVDRPEGGYLDTSRTGGLVLDAFHRPPNGTPLAALDPMARALWEQLSQPQTSLSAVKVPASWLRDDVGPGDLFPTHFRCGVLRPTGSADGFRVSVVTLDRETNMLELA